MRFDGHGRGGRERGEPLPDPVRGVPADRVAVADPVCASLLGSEREFGQEPVVRPRPVLGVHADRLRTAVPGRGDGRRHLADDGSAVQLAAELVRDHLVRGRDRQVVVAQAKRDCLLHVGRDCAAPPGQPQVAEGSGPRKRNVRADVGLFVEEERKPDLGLRYAQLGQVEVDHRLAELGQAGARCLDAVAVGDIQEMDLSHASLRRRFRLRSSA